MFWFNVLQRFIKFLLQMHIYRQKRSVSTLTLNWTMRTPVKRRSGYALNASLRISRTYVIKELGGTLFHRS